MKKSINKLVALILLTVAPLLFFAGCEQDPHETPVPWSQPADWEGQIPGMGGR